MEVKQKVVHFPWLQGKLSGEGLGVQGQTNQGAVEIVDSMKNKKVVRQNDVTGYGITLKLAEGLEIDYWLTKLVIDCSGANAGHQPVILASTIGSSLVVKCSWRITIT